MLGHGCACRNVVSGGPCFSEPIGGDCWVFAQELIGFPKKPLDVFDALSNQSNSRSVSVGVSA